MTSIADDRASLFRRVAVSIGVSLLFLTVYGGSLAITAVRSNIPSFYFSWETHLPFVALTIVPYLSIDLFFIAAPLLITTNRALRRYALRIALAITLAGVFFLLMPLKFAFDRPTVQGSVGFIFQQFQRADLPFNQFPSLHIALLMIVGDVFIRKTKGAARMAVMIWFSLIAVSPVLVFQHHVIDIAGGFVLGLLCLGLVTDDGEREPFERNWRVVAYYLVGGVSLLGLSIWIGRASWPLWWVAASLMVVAAGYGLVGPSIYIKRHGRLHWTTRLLLWPTLLGQAASHRWYARFAQPYDKLSDRLWIGRLLSQPEAEAAILDGVVAVIDLTCEFSEPPAFRRIPYLNLPTLDLTAPMPSQLTRAIEFIDAQSGPVYVHCKAGYSRTAAVAAAYLLATQQATSVSDAIARIRAARPTLIVRPEIFRRLARLYENNAEQCRSL